MRGTGGQPGLGGELGRDQELNTGSTVEIFDYLGAAYLKYSFTRGTEQEVDFLVDALGLSSGDRLLDVGCGPGRHAALFTDRGIEVAGVDLSARFVELAAAAVPAASFVRADARRLPVRATRSGTRISRSSREVLVPERGVGAFEGFDAVISLCQGAFGLVGDDDGQVLEEMARATRRGGRLAFTAFAAYFAVRFLEEGDHFDAGAGIHHETTTVKNETGEEREFALATSCFTPRELRLLCERAGLVVEGLWSVTPGAYATDPPDIDHPELLVLASKPG